MIFSTRAVSTAVPWLLLQMLGFAAATPAQAVDISRTITVVKPAVVGIGTYQRLRTPAIRFVATGFATGDGLSVITNAHSIPPAADNGDVETLGVVTGAGTDITFRPATLTGLDKEHDLAHLRLSGVPLPALAIGDSDTVQEGRELAFTGFPLGMALGLNRVTHRAMVAAIAPVAMPAAGARNLPARILNQLRSSAFPIFQLDGTAYPGNSGSPLYDPETGQVLGVINMVLIKGLKESAITSPSGISYAIPSAHVVKLLRNK